MSTTIKLSDSFIELAKPYAQATHRSISEQIEYWAKLAKAIEDNPDMPFQFIQDTLLGIEEVKMGRCSTYRFE